MRLITHLFTEHPQSVRETYFQHMYTAFSFGLAMTLSGLACLVHGLFPFLFTNTGGKTIAKLHDDMLVNRKVH